MLYLKINYANKLNSKYSIYISFNYNPSYVELIKQFKNVRWIPEIKEWEMDYCNFSEFINYLNVNSIPYNGKEFESQIEEFKKQINQNKNSYFQEKNTDVETLINTTQFKTTPYNYQIEGIKYGLTHDNFLLSDDAGLGKSLQTSNIACLKRGGKHCLILVGYDSLQFNWVKEIEKHTNEKAMVLGQRLNRNKRYVLGNVKKRYEDLENIDNIEEFFIITALTTLRQARKKSYINKQGKEKVEKEFYFADKVEELCRQGKIGRIIFDEAHTCKNYDVDQTQALLRLKSAPYKIAATGTPITNRNLDLYPIMNWLGCEDRNYWQFRENYCNFGGFKGKEIIGNKNNQELHERLNTFMLRRKKDDVLDLPEKIIIDEYLEMDGNQYALYQKICSMTKAELYKSKFNKIVLLSSLLNLRKITCHPSWYDEDYTDSVKYKRALQIIQESVANGRKTILFSNFTTPFKSENQLVNIYNFLKEYNPAMIIGETKDRMLQVDKFQNDDSCSVIVGSIGAMGTGLTLNKASTVIFLDEPWNEAVKSQAIDRSHRIGTKYPVNIYTLMCRDTVDEKVHTIVNKKGRIADEIVDGVTLEELHEILEI